MLLQNMKCPYGCKNSTFTEVIKEINQPNNNLLLERKSVSKKIKIYTCHCCNKSFEIPMLTENKNNLLYS